MLFIFMLMTQGFIASKCHPAVSLLESAFDVVQQRFCSLNLNANKTKVSAANLLSLTTFLDTVKEVVAEYKYLATLSAIKFKTNCNFRIHHWMTMQWFSLFKTEALVPVSFTNLFWVCCHSIFSLGRTLLKEIFNLRKFISWLNKGQIKVFIYFKNHHVT